MNNSTKGKPLGAVGLVERELKNALAKMHQHALLKEVGADYRFPAGARVDEVWLSPEEVSVAYVLTPHKKQPAGGARAWSARRKAWAARPREYAVEDLEGGAVRVRAMYPWKLLRRMVADMLGPEFERLLPLAMAKPLTPRVELTMDALRLMCGKIASRDGGDVPLRALRDVLAAAPGWSAEDAVAPRAAVERDERANAALAAVAARPRWGVRVSKARTVIWHYDRSLTQADADDVLSAMARVDADGNAGALAEGALTYRAASIVNDSPKSRSPVLYGWGRDVLVVEGLGVATPCVVATPPSGRDVYLFLGRTWEVKGPSGEAVELADPGDFWDAAYAEGLGDDCDAMLASFGPDELERLMYRMGVKDWTHTGECQLCARVQKLKAAPGAAPPSDHAMVDHGFRFPMSEHRRGGDRGYREGSCEAVGHPPYERSCAFLRDVILPRHEGWLKEAEEWAAEVDGAVRGRASLKVPARWLDAAADADAPRVEVKHGHELWRRAADLCLAEAAGEVRRVASYVDWLRARVGGWKPRPLYDEVEAAKRAAKAGAAR